MKIRQHKKRNDIRILEVDSGINTKTAAEFSSTSDELVRGDHPLVIMDCTRLRFLTSYGIGMMVMLYSKVAKAEGDIKIASVGPAIAKVLEMTRIDTIIGIEPDMDAATASLKPRD